MPDYRLPYGKTHLTLTLPADRHVEVIAPGEVPPAPDPDRLVQQALDAPVGGGSLDQWAGARSAAVVIADKTRPSLREALIPLLVRLEAMGIPPASTTILIASGTHAPMPAHEFSALLPPEILARYPVIAHDCDAQNDLVFLGTTRRGTPVTVNRHFHAADLRIVLGNVEPHQFMGFSGGAKSAAIGVAGRETINANHTLMLDPHSVMGEYETNPTRQDVEEIGQLMDIHLAVNTILNAQKKIVHVFAGTPLAVMQAALPTARAIYEVPVAAPLDLVISSSGGYPKDINLYQGQKALAHAARVTADGGTVILVAACSEGIGSAAYEQWVTGMESHEAVLERFAHEEFRLGKHKAFQIARDAVRINALLKSELPDDTARKILLPPVHDLNQAVASILDRLPPEARIGIMSAGNVTVPVLQTTTNQW